MSKSIVVRFSLIAVLLVAVTTLVKEHRGFSYGFPAGVLATQLVQPTMLADAIPIPWPKAQGKPATSLAVPITVADSLPIPWPKAQGKLATPLTAPATVADSLPIPWPKMSTKPAADAC